MGFEGQVVVVTGASSGIGLALALALGKRKARVGVIARRRESLEDLVSQIQRAGGTALAVPADVAEREQVHHAIRAIVQGLGPIDLLVANAGVGAPTHLDPLNVDDAERMLRVNTLGVMYAIEAVLPDMLKRSRGHVAAVSSLAAYKGLPGEAAYCASKAAVNIFLEALRIQLHGRGVAVTTICPGFVRTPMTSVNDFSMPFLMEPEEAARRIVGALERRVKVFNFPWTTTLLIKMTRWLPDRLMARIMQNYTEHPPLPAPGLNSPPETSHKGEQPGIGSKDGPQE